MPCSAPIDVKIILQMQEHPPVRPFFSLPTPAHLLVCPHAARVCVLLAFYFNVLSLSLCVENLPSERHLSAGAAWTHNLDERIFFFHVHSTFKLYELVFVMLLSFGRLIEN